MSSNDLNSLVQSNNTDQIKLDYVLQTWMKNENEVTWKMIIDVVRGPLIKDKVLAKKIFQYLKQTFSEQQKATSNYINN